MKKNKHILYRPAFPFLVTAVCCLLLGMASCKKEQPVERLHADMVDFAVSGQKAYIDPDQYSCFIVGENMRVNNSQGTVSALERNGRQCVIDDVPVPNDNKYGAVYPASLLTNNNENLSNGVGGTLVTLPRVQHYESDALRNQIIQNPMAAELSNASASNSTLHFRNLCALLKIMVQTDDPFDSIRVTIDGKALHGAGVINTSQTNWKVDMTSPNEEHSVVLSMDDHHVSAAGETFYIVIPEVNLQASTRVTVQLLNGSSLVKTWRYTTAAAVTLTANHIHTLGSFIFNSRVFSVSATKKVYFSPGNLQWSYTNEGTIPTTHSINDINNGYNKGTWRFAPNQYDIIGNYNENALGNASGEYSQTSYTGWIDLFAWGSSGYGDSRPFYYSGNYYCNDNSLGNYDWGAFNTIYNPKTKANDPSGTWHTLTGGEWTYLLNSRSGWRYSIVAVYFGSGNIVDGLIIYPDNTYHVNIDGDPNNVNNPFCVNATLFPNTSSSYNITKAEYDVLESLGCAFLPNAGRMAHWSSNEYEETDNRGLYWCNSVTNGNKDYLIVINGGGPLSIANMEGKYFLSVRLARDVN